MPITPPVRVISCHIRWPINVLGRLIYRLIVEADGGDFVAAKYPDIFNAHGQPVTLAAEPAAGSVVRVSVSDDDVMTAAQLAGAKFDNPFARCFHRVEVVLTGNLSGSPWPKARHPASVAVTGWYRNLCDQNRCREVACVMAVPAPTIVLAANLHHPIRVTGVEYCSLVTEAGVFFAATRPDIFDGHVAPRKAAVPWAG